MICKNCKKEIPDGSKYCYLCGTIFEEQNTNDTAQNQTDNVNTMSAYNSSQQQSGNTNPNNGYSAPPQQGMNTNPNNGYYQNQQGMNNNPNNQYRPVQPPPIIKPKKNKKGLKTFFIVLGSIVGAILLLLFILFMVAIFTDDSSSNGNVSNSTTNAVSSGPQIIDTTLATKVDDYTQEAIDIVDFFYPNAPTINVVAQVSGFEANTKMTCEWFYLETSELLGTSEAVSDFDSGYINFYLNVNSGSLPIGRYKAKFYINGVASGERNFEVRENEASNSTSSGAKIGQIVMSLEEEDSEPVNITDYFSPDSPTIYIFCDVSGLNLDSTVTADWYFYDPDTFLGSIDQVPGFDQGIVFFSANKPEGGWPVGQYSIVISIDGVELEQHSFYVE